MIFKIGLILILFLILVELDDIANNIEILIKILKGK